jgi:hypothetical protein
MWIRWITMPWSLRWLLTSVVLLSFYGGITLAQVLEHPARLPAWLAPAVIGVCLLGGALGAANQQMRTAPYRAVLSGLTADQRRELAAAIKPGSLPTDPAILAAAVRIRSMARAERARRPIWQSWAVISLGMGYAAWLMTMPGGLAVATGLLVVEALCAVLLLWGQARRHRTEPRWDALAAAAVANPSAAAMLTAARDVPVNRDWRRWATLIAAAAVIGAGYGATNFATRSAQIAECRLAANVVNYIAENKELLDSDRLTAKQPPQSAYQQWATQLESEKDAAQGKAFGTDVARISDLAAQIVNSIDAIRQLSTPNPASQHEITQFRTLVTQLVDAEQPLVRTCR